MLKIQCTQSVHIQEIIDLCLKYEACNWNRREVNGGSIGFLRNQTYIIGLHSYSGRFLIIWTPFWFISVFESTAYRKIAVYFLWFSLPDHYRVTDEALLAETAWYDPSSFLWMFSVLLKELILDFDFWWKHAWFWHVCAYFCDKINSLLYSSE